MQLLWILTYLLRDVEEGIERFDIFLHEKFNQ